MKQWCSSWGSRGTKRYPINQLASLSSPPEPAEQRPQLQHLSSASRADVGSRHHQSLADSITGGGINYIG